MDMLTKELGFITEESFDFELEFQSSDSLEHVSQEEEVFLGPVKHVERCVARSVDLNAKDSAGQVVAGTPDWSPVGAERLEEFYREANRLARQLERAAVKENLGHSPLVAALIKDKKPQRSPRRETYVVKDSPVRLLLPDISFDSEDGLASPSLQSKSDSSHATAKVTPTTAKVMPTSRKVTPAGTKTTSEKEKTTHNARKTIPTTTYCKTKPALSQASTFVGSAVDEPTPTTGMVVPTAKKDVANSDTTVNSPKRQIAPVKSRPGPSRSSSAAVRRQPPKSGRGASTGCRSSVAQRQSGLGHNAGLGVCPGPAQGAREAHSNPRVVPRAKCGLASTVACQLSSRVSGTKEPPVCAGEDSKSRSTSLSARQTARAGSGTQMTLSTSVGVPRLAPSQSATQPRPVTSNAGVSRLPVFRNVPAVRPRSARSISQGSQAAPVHCSVSKGDSKGHRLEPDAVPK